jgi:hypothetical protein
MNGEMVSKIDSELRDRAGDYLNSTSPEDRAYGRGIETVRRQFGQFFATDNPNAATRVQAADRAWARYSVLRSAGAKTAREGSEGQMTPQQLATAQSQMDETFKKTATGEHRGIYQELADAAIDAGIARPNDESRLGRLAALGGGVFGAHELGMPVAGNPAVAAAAIPAYYALGWGYTAAHPAIRAAAPLVRPMLNQGLPRAAMAASMPSQSDLVRRALLGEQQ